MLVGRLGGALIHGGAIVDDDGGAWLLVGDSHAGKTTTCVSLVDAGWRYLADDQVVLRRDGANSLVVEGWPREPHLDAGWTSGTITGQRIAFDLAARWPTGGGGRRHWPASCFPMCAPITTRRLVG